MQKAWGTHTTHNTAECRHDKKDGTPTKGTFGQSGRKSGKVGIQKRPMHKF